MTKVHFDYSSLSTEVIPSLESTISSLNSLANSSSSLNVPGDFRYAKDLRTLDSFFEEKSDDLSYIKEWLRKNNTNYSQSIDLINDMLLQIDQEQIGKRQKIVK